VTIITCLTAKKNNAFQHKSKPPEPEEAHCVSDTFSKADTAGKNNDIFPLLLIVQCVCVCVCVYACACACVCVRSHSSQFLVISRGCVWTDGHTCRKMTLYIPGNHPSCPPPPMEGRYGGEEEEGREGGTEGGRWDCGVSRCLDSFLCRFLFSALRSASVLSAASPVRRNARQLNSTQLNAVVPPGPELS